MISNAELGAVASAGSCTPEPAPDLGTVPDLGESDVGKLGTLPAFEASRRSVARTTP